MEGCYSAMKPVNYSLLCIFTKTCSFKFRLTDHPVFFALILFSVYPSHGITIMNCFSILLLNPKQAVFRFLRFIQFFSYQMFSIYLYLVSDISGSDVLTNGEANDSCGNSGTLPPPKKKRKIRYKFQENSGVNICTRRKFAVILF